MTQFPWMTPGYGDWMNPDTANGGGFQGLLGNPLFNVGLGLLAANQPGTSFSQALGRGGLLGLQNMQQFQQAQAQLGSSLGRLLATFERYPDLKSNQNFLTLQAQIEGTENSILVARRDYNESVRQYNTTIRTFPDSIGARIFYGAKPKVPFEAAAGAQEAPKVDFNAA